MKVFRGSKYYDLSLDCKRDGYQQIFRWLNFAVSQDAKHPFLMGVRIEEDKAMSADGFRAHIVRKPLWNNSNFSIPPWEPPKAYTGERERISYYAAYAGHWAKDLFEIRRHTPPKTMIINDGGRLRKTAGKLYPIKCFVDAHFPNIERIRPPQGNQIKMARMTVDADWLQWLCDMPDIVRVHFGFKKSGDDVILDIMLMDDKKDKTHVTTPFNVDSEIFEDAIFDMDFAFNPQYISEAAEMPVSLGGIELDFYASKLENGKWTGGDPIVIRGHGGTYEAIIMPMNIGRDN